MIEERLLELIRAALETAAAGLGFDGDLPEPELLPTKKKEHGDFATNVALVLASQAGKNPREVAEAIRAAFPEAPFVERVEVAGPGFLNVFVTDEWLYDALRDVVAKGASYGAGGAQRQARPGGVRQRQPDGTAPRGSCPQRRARRCHRSAARARRVGRGARVLLQRRRRPDGPVRRVRRGALPHAIAGSRRELPEDGYHGVVHRRARPRVASRGRHRTTPTCRTRSGCRWSGTRPPSGCSAGSTGRSNGSGCASTRTCPRRRSPRSGEIDQAIERLARGGHIYEEDGAVWFRSTAFGDDKDRVVIRSNGVHTYFAADCAYVIDKFSRGFDHLIYVWGADHHGDVVRVKGAAQALGYDPDAAEIVLYQFVAFLRGRRTGEMSKRAGNFISLDAADRRGRHGRRPVHAAAVLQRLDRELRHRGREAADHGEPRLLRAVRARADREHPPQGRVPGGRVEGDRRRRPLAPDARQRARPLARARGGSRPSSRSPRSNAVRIA